MSAGTASADLIQLAELAPAAASILLSAEYIDAMIARLTSCVSLGVDEFVGELKALATALASAGVTVKSAARRLCSHRLQWLEKGCEELDGVEKALLACARLCDSGNIGWDELVASVAPSLRLVECDVSPRQSCVIDVDMGTVGPVLEALSVSTWVQDDVEPARTTLCGDILDYFHPSKWFGEAWVQRDTDRRETHFLSSSPPRAVSRVCVCAVSTCSVLISCV